MTARQQYFTALPIVFAVTLIWSAFTELDVSTQDVAYWALTSLLFSALGLAAWMGFARVLAGGGR